MYLDINIYDLIDFLNCNIHTEMFDCINNLLIHYNIIKMDILDNLFDYLIVEKINFFHIYLIQRKNSWDTIIQNYIHHHNKNPDMKNLHI